MRLRSLRARLGVSLILGLVVLWLAVAGLVGRTARAEIEKVFDAALRETAERILPLAATEIMTRDTKNGVQRLAPLREHDEIYTYIVRDAAGEVVLQSHAADPLIFPPWTGPGFAQSGQHRFYGDSALRGTLSITVAEPLAHRRAVLRDLAIGLSVPLALVVPLGGFAIAWAVRYSLRPVRRFRARLDARGPHDLSPVPSADLPSEIAPVAATLNDLLGRLGDALASERNFAANAAHELRTPIAGAIAQLQRLRNAQPDATQAASILEVEATLKRLTRLAESLIQLARAEGAPIRSEREVDLVGMMQMLARDWSRGAEGGRVRLNVPARAVMSDLDPDAFGIILRNLVENALRHGREATAVDVSLGEDGVLRVINHARAMSPAELAALRDRFARGDARSEGSGLGLAIVSALARRLGTELSLATLPGPHGAVFEARLDLPVRRGEAGA